MISYRDYSTIQETMGAPLGRYGVPRYSMVHVSPLLVDQGALCLLVFANGIPKEEAIPYFRYTRVKKYISPRQSVVVDATGCAADQENRRDVVKFGAIVIERPVNMGENRPMGILEQSAPNILRSLETRRIALL